MTILRGSHVEEEILAYAQAQNASAIVIAQTRPRPLAGWFGQTMTQRLLRRNKGLEIIIVGSKTERRSSPRQRSKAWFGTTWRAPLRHYLLAVCIVAAAVFVSAVLVYLLPLPVETVSLVFLTGVLVVAARTSLPAALLAVVMSSLALNFFFLKPQFSLAYGAAEIIATLLFLVVAVVGGNLANRLRAQVAALRATNEHSQMLLDLSKRLAEAANPTEARRVAVEAITEFKQTPACLLAVAPQASGLRVVAAASELVELNERERSAAEWALEHGQPGGYRSKALSDVGWRFLPLFLDETCYGVLGIKLGDLPTRPGSEELLLLDTLANQVTLALARTDLSLSLEQARIAEEGERLRSALLSSVSHDLRTPLSSIIGAASTLRDLGEQISETNKRELLDSVVGEGQRLNRYIQNLLDMTRLGHGAMKLNRDWVSLADIVAASLHRLKEDLVGLQVVRDVPAELPLLYVNPALIEQTLVNVVENAARFSPTGGELRIAGRRDQEHLLITVSDQGPGIPADDRKRVFEMFFSGEGGDTGKHGSGLGLAICHGMVEAHGGTMEVLDGPGGRGTTIVMRLPLQDQPDATGEEARSSHGYQ